MTDEYQTRADIEKLYDLIYARTTEEQSPVAQKEELDSFKEEVYNNYATSDTVDQKVSIEEFESAMDTKADVTTWQTLYNETQSGVTAKLEVNGINVRLTITSSNVEHTTSFVSKHTISSDYQDYFPQYGIYTVGGSNSIYRFLKGGGNDHNGYFQIASSGSTVTKDIYTIIEWTI